MHVSKSTAALTLGFSSSQAYRQGHRREDEVLQSRTRETEREVREDPRGDEPKMKRKFTSKSPERLRSLACLFESDIG
jgi:hypothetical protein